MMPEILTESFCERCGTRYTFESAAPRKIRRLGKVKTLSKGLKNYVLSDETSMDEAMAAARSDVEREATAQQLDAFHATFNFCMNCRQYTCGNCWNQAEGRCLTCSPLSIESLEAPFREEAPYEPPVIAADAWPTADLRPVEAAAANPWGNGSALGTEDAAPELIGVETAEAATIEPEPIAASPEPEPEPVIAEAAVAAEPVAAEPTAPEPVAAEPVAAQVEDPWRLGEDDPGAHFSFLKVEADQAEPLTQQARVPEPIAADAAPEPIEEPAARTTEAASAEAAAADEPPVKPLGDGVEERASDLAGRTSRLFGRFRPGQNIDAELAAFEAELDRAPATDAEEKLATEAPTTADATSDEVPVAVSVEALLRFGVTPEPIGDEPEQAPEPIAVAPEPEPEPVAAVAEPEPVAAAQEPESEPVAAVAEPVAAEPEPEPEPVAAVVEPEPEPVAAVVEPEPAPIAASAAPELEPEPVAPPVERTRQDRVPQPTWQVFAPEPTAPPVLPNLEPPVVPPTPAVPLRQPLASGEPQWPAQPSVEDSPSMILLAKGARTSSDALWAASARQVLAPPVPGPAAVTSGVQPCSSCGLSLSATARFCRRCGTRQG